MKRKYELTIATSYVPDWTFVEAFRELFQNALDNQITTPENVMGFSFNSEEGIVRISNKTSILEIETLLLGSTTKATDKNTIGKHGEGYKVAFMVLLREGKSIKVYNYGKREIWIARLVKSKRFNGQLVPTIFVESEAFWKSVPDNDLTIEVSGVTAEEYEVLVEKNLNLRTKVNAFPVPNMGRILTKEKEKGNIYVKGLFICNLNKLQFGYDFEPALIDLDRDRKLVKEFDVAWQTSAMWKYAYGKGFSKKDIRGMLFKKNMDVEYFKSRNYTPAIQSYEDDSKIEQNLAEDLAADFISQHGHDSIPITDNRELTLVQQHNSKPVIVNDVVAAYINKATTVQIKRIPQEPTLKEQFQSLLDDVEGKLSDEEVERFTQLINKLQ